MNPLKVLELVDVYSSYGESDVLRGMNLEIGRGEIVALLGRNGMGKSTTAKLFSESGCEVWDADSSVHRLYEKGGAAVDPISKIFLSCAISVSIRDQSFLMLLILFIYLCEVIC